MGFWVQKVRDRELDCCIGCIPESCVLVSLLFGLDIVFVYAYTHFQCVVKYFVFLACNSIEVKVN